MDIDGKWTLRTLRKSTPGDPVNATTAGVSRFGMIAGDEREVMEYYDTYAQPGTEIILAEVRDPQHRVVALFDRVAEALALRDDGPHEAVLTVDLMSRRIAGAATGRQ